MEEFELHDVLGEGEDADFRFLGAFLGGEGGGGGKESGGSVNLLYHYFYYNAEL